jgi:uncharacterized protein YndB with AHSA1/START domain
MSTDTFTFTRNFPLSADRMWILLTAPEYREIWGAPDDNQVLETISSDFSIGGVDHHRCGPADQPEFEVKTRWYNIDAPAAATFTETIIAGGMALGVSLVTYALSPATKGCDLVITVAVASFVGPEMMDEFKAGWTGGMAKLDRIVAQEIG